MPLAEKFSKKKIGLALGGGSARGLSHIGVILALQEADIQINCIAGTSIGALVGAVFCAGKLKVLEGICQHLSWKQMLSFVDVVPPSSGLLDGKKIAAFLREHIRETDMEDLPIPFAAIATDLACGQAAVIQKGNIIDAVRASFAIPGIFTPVKRGGKILVDGGLVDPVPVQAARDLGADFVLAVDLNHHLIPLDSEAKKSKPRPVEKPKLHVIKHSPLIQALNQRLPILESPRLAHFHSWLGRDELPGIFDVFADAILIMQEQITRARLAHFPPDLLIQPNLSAIRFHDYTLAPQAIAEGYRAAKAALENFSAASS